MNTIIHRKSVLKESVNDKKIGRKSFQRSNRQNSSDQVNDVIIHTKIEIKSRLIQ